jgi:hypothetical protein
MLYEGEGLKIMSTGRSTRDRGLGTPPTSSIEACFYNRGFPVEIMHGVQYMRIKLTHFQKSKNRGLIPAILTAAEFEIQNRHDTNVAYFLFHLSG